MDCGRYCRRQDNGVRAASRVGSRAGANGVHTPAGSVFAGHQYEVPRSSLPVYKRQLFPDRLLGERVEYGHTIFETDAVRCWHTGDEIAIVSFKSKMHAIGDDVLDGVVQATMRRSATTLGW